MPRTVLNLERYVPAYLTQITNKWARSSSRIYLKKFHIGINEWRVLSLLAIEFDITANRICSVIGMDKAAVGRSIQLLEERGYVSLAPNPADGRSRLISLTESGHDLHDQIVTIALDRERQLVQSLTRDEIDTLIALLSRLRENVVRMQVPELE